MNTPSQVERHTLYYEKLESEPDVRRKVSQQLRRSKERTHKQTVARSVLLYATLTATSHL